MYSNQVTRNTRFKVGLFFLSGLFLIWGLILLINKNPFWWRTCQFVEINVEDATGLKSKSPIRSLGIDIGYLKSVELMESHVILGICITAPVEVLSSTRAYIRADGFLGDKFVELKPVRQIKTLTSHDNKTSKNWLPWHWLEKEVYADEGEEEALSSELQVRRAPKSVDAGPTRNRIIPVGPGSQQDIQHVVNRMDHLVEQVSKLTQNLTKAINPDELRNTMKQLSQVLENVSKTVAPEGGLTQTAQRSLGKLEDSMDQLRTLLTRINQGQGSLGMLLNDPSYAEEVRVALKNVNRLLTKFGEVRFVIDVGATELSLYNGSRAWFQVGIWPRKDRYYLLGATVDPRGRITNSTVTTTAGGITQTTQTQVVEQTTLVVTAMLGKVYWDRFDFSLGALYGDGALSVAFRFGPAGSEDRLQFRNDLYFRGSTGSGVDDRMTLTAYPIANLYVRAGIESFRSHPGLGNGLLYSFGAGISFDDEDIKVLFALK